MAIEWTQSKERLLREWAGKCTNLHQLSQRMGLSYSTVMKNQEIRARLEWALMENWGNVGEEGLETLKELMNTSDNENIRLDAAKKLVDVAERQKDRIAAHKIEIYEKPLEDTGLKAVYEKIRSIKEGRGEDGELVN